MWMCREAGYVTKRYCYVVGILKCGCADIKVRVMC